MESDFNLYWPTVITVRVEYVRTGKFIIGLMNFEPSWLHFKLLVNGSVLFRLSMLYTLQMLKLYLDSSHAQQQ